MFRAESESIAALLQRSCSFINNILCNIHIHILIVNIYTLNKYGFL